MNPLVRLPRASFFLILTLVCFGGPAFGQPRTPKFFVAYACPEKGPRSICILGTVQPGNVLALVTGNEILPLDAKDTFPNTEGAPTDHKIETITRAEAPKAIDHGGLAVMAPAQSIKIVYPAAVEDKAFVGRVDGYLATFFKGWATFKASTQILRLSPTVSIADVTVEYSLMEEPIPSNGQCSSCNENTFLLRAANDAGDLYRVERSSDGVIPVCGELAFAFELSGRLHTYSHGFLCESDVDFALVHDISGPTPRLVMRY
jgi:hypothetical protein